MAIVSLKFLLFVMIIMAILCICNAKYRWLVLLCGSIVFYMIAGIRFLPYILFTSFSIWFGTRKIGVIWEKQEKYLQSTDDSAELCKSRKESDKRKAKRILFLVLVMNVGILCCGKIISYVYTVLQSDPSATLILLPLGISYYTFSTVGYLLDVYWKRYPHEKNYLRFLLFAIYFPHIVQGPISRYDKLGKELKKPLQISIENISAGAILVLWGYMKKLVIADRLNVFTSTVFSTLYNNGMVYLVAVLIDALQIYVDFSGYMDIMCGISQMCGIELEANFEHPFFSRTVAEFWRRWHMTLGGWFKDYVYYPIMNSRRMKKISRWSKEYLPKWLCRFVVSGIPIMIVWILTGLWHGTGAGYVAWGIYYGSLITISVAGEDVFQKINCLLHINTDCFSFRLFQMCRTFCIFAGGRLLTKGSRFKEAVYMILKIIVEAPKNMQSLFDGSLLNYGLNGTNMIYAFLGIVLIWGASMLQLRYNIREKLLEQNIVFRWAVYITCIFLIFVFGIYGSSYSTAGFAYQQF